MRLLFFLVLTSCASCFSQEVHQEYTDFLTILRTRPHTAEDVYRLFTHIVKEKMARDRQKTGDDKPFYQKGIDQGLISPDPSRYIGRMILEDVETTQESPVYTAGHHRFFNLLPFLVSPEECGASEFFLGHHSGKLSPSFIPTLHHEAQHLLQRLNMCTARAMGYYIPEKVDTLPSFIGSSPAALQTYLKRAETTEGIEEINRHRETEADREAAQFSPFLLSHFQNVLQGKNHDELISELKKQFEEQHAVALSSQDKNIEAQIRVLRKKIEESDAVPVLIKNGYLTDTQKYLLYKQRLQNIPWSTYIFYLVPQMIQHRIACEFQQGLDKTNNIYEHPKIIEDLNTRIKAYGQIFLQPRICGKMLLFLHSIVLAMAGLSKFLPEEVEPRHIAFMIGMPYVLGMGMIGWASREIGIDGIRKLNHWPHRGLIFFTSYLSYVRHSFLSPFSLRAVASHPWLRQRSLKEKMEASYYRSHQLPKL